MAYKPKHLNRNARPTWLEAIRAAFEGTECNQWLEAQKHRLTIPPSDWVRIESLDTYPITDRWVSEKVLVYASGERVSIVCEKMKGWGQPWRIVAASVLSLTTEG